MTRARVGQSRPQLLLSIISGTLIFSVSFSASTRSAEARLSCRPEPGPGRVLCELEVEAPGGRVLPWADALVVSSPAHAPPLRSRYGPTHAAARTESRLRLPIALAAVRAGRGQLEVDARRVTCRSDGSVCVSEVSRVVALVEVGVEPP
ncbi:MAG: hypothetical protein KF718_22130 [Polyangiaceae bacterium]|nr:hypothetical protein [Polyangiaceae bacterium]